MCHFKQTHTMSITNLHDEEIRGALIAARIPQQFHPKDSTLRAYQKHSGVPPLLEHLQRVKDGLRPALASRVVLIEDVYDSPDGTAIAYHVARSLVLTGVQTRCCHTSRIMADQEEESYLLYHGGGFVKKDVVVLLGFAEAGLAPNPYDRGRVHAMEWMLDNALAQGKGLVLHTTGAADALSQWWSRRFVNRIKECLAFHVEVRSK